MKFSTRIPVAWLQLTRNKVRLLVAVIGIAFAVILMFMQLAFLDSLYDSQTMLHRRLNGDLVLTSSKLKTLTTPRYFPRQYLYRTMNLQEVESVNHLYYEQGSLKYGERVGGKGIVIVGINPHKSPINFPDSNRLLPLLKTIGFVLFDRDSDIKEYGSILEDLEKRNQVSAELNGKRIWIADTLDFGGASFADDGNLVTSSATFLKVTGRRADEITIGLIHLKPGIDPQVALKKIESQIPVSLKVLTKSGFIDREKNYWSTSAPIGFIFGIGVFVSFLVGTIIVYQILYNEVSDRLPDYAILKARGYQHRYFLKILFQEASILAVLGYIPGFVLSVGLYAVSKDATALPIQMTGLRAIFVLGLTVVMCFVSGAITMQKLREADPADLFS